MDSEYLKQHVGEALAIGLTEIVQKRPVDPVEYLAHWLRKYVENRDFELQVSMKIPSFYHLLTFEVQISYISTFNVSI